MNRMKIEPSVQESIGIQGTEKRQDAQRIRVTTTPPATREVHNAVHHYKSTSSNHQLSRARQT
jgi:hypothetical protein